MKVNFKNSQHNNKMFRYKRDIAGKDEHNKDINIYNDTHRPTRAISFSGSAVSLGQKAINGLVENQKLNKVIDFVNENEAAYNAIYSLIVAGMLKPIFVMAMPGSEEKDKQIVATKNSLQAFIGSFLSFTIGGGFVKKIFDKVKTNLKLIKINGDNLEVVDSSSKSAIESAKHVVKKEKSSLTNKFKLAKNAAHETKGIKKVGAFVSKIFKKVNVDFNNSQIQDEVNAKASELVENCKKNHLPVFQKNTSFTKDLLTDEIKNDYKSSLYDAFESFWKNSTGWVTTIFKAKISSILLPTVLAFLFAKKNQQKEESAQKAQNDTDIAKTKSTEFEQFMKKTSQVNFKGNNYDKIIDSLAKGIENVSMTKAGQAPVKLLSKAKHTSARMGDFESAMLTGYWVANTSKSKKIHPSQKLGLNVHTVLVSVVSGITAFVMDALTDKPIDKASELYKQKIVSAIDSTKEIADSQTAINQLKEQCKNLLNSKEIVEKLTNDQGILKGDQLEEALKKLTKNYNKKLSKFKSLTLFTFIVRFLVPVLMVPISGKLKKKIIEFTNKKKNSTNTENAKQPA